MNKKICVFLLCLVVTKVMPGRWTNKSEFMQDFEADWVVLGDIISNEDVKEVWGYMQGQKQLPANMAKKQSEWDALYTGIEVKYNKIQMQQDAIDFKSHTELIIDKLTKILKDGREIGAVEEFVKLFEIKGTGITPAMSEKIIKLAWDTFIVDGVVKLGEKLYAHPFVIAMNLGLYKFLSPLKKTELNKEFNDRVIKNQPTAVMDISEYLLKEFKQRAWMEFNPELMSGVVAMVNDGMPLDLGVMDKYLKTLTYAKSVKVGVTQGKGGDIPILIDVKIDTHILEDDKKNYGNWFFVLKQYICAKFNQNLYRIKLLDNNDKDALKNKLVELKIWGDLPSGAQAAFETFVLPADVSGVIAELDPTLKDNQIGGIGVFSKLTFAQIKSDIEKITPHVGKLSEVEITRLVDFLNKNKVKSDKSIASAVTSVKKLLGQALLVFAQDRKKQKDLDDKEKQVYEAKKAEKEKLALSLQALKSSLSGLAKKLELLRDGLKKMLSI